MKKEKKKQERSKKNILYKNWYETKKTRQMTSKKKMKKRVNKDCTTELIAFSELQSAQ